MLKQVLISQTRPRRFIDLESFLDTTNGIEYTLCSNVTYRLLLVTKQSTRGKWELVVTHDGGETAVRLKRVKDQPGYCVSFRLNNISGYASMTLKHKDVEVLKWKRAVKVYARNDDGCVPLSWQIHKRDKKRCCKTATNTLYNTRQVATSQELDVASEQIDFMDESDDWPGLSLDNQESESNCTLPSPIELNEVGFVQEVSETAFEMTVF